MTAPTAAEQLAEQRHYDLTVQGAEWLKKEQNDRIKTRAQIIYWTVGAMFLLGGTAFTHHAVLLAMAPLGAILGWAWLGEDRKITQIREHLVHDIAPILAIYTGDRPALLWETMHTQRPRRLTTKLIDLALMLLLFVGPGFIGAAVWDVLDGSHGGMLLWFAWLGDLILVGVITWQLIANADVEWHLVRTRLAARVKLLRQPRQQGPEE